MITQPSRIILIAAMAAAASALWAAGAADGRKTAQTGRIAYVEGEVSINGVPAELGQKVEGLVAVSTGADSYCEIVFADKNIVRFNQNAVASIDFSKPVIEVDLDKGGAAAVLHKLKKIAGNESLQVRTKTAIAGVRGTSFCVWTGDGETYICACNGTVRTIDAKGSNEFTLASSHHTAKLYSTRGDEISAESAGMLRHDDSTIESLAARIGEKIDWTKIED